MKYDLVKLDTNDLKLVDEQGDVELIKDCIKEIATLQKSSTIAQWVYTLEHSEMKGQLQYPTDDNRYLQVKLQIETVIHRIIDRHYNFNKHSAEMEVFQFEIEKLQKKWRKNKKVLAGIKLAQNEIMLKQFLLHQIRYCLEQDIIELHNFKELLKKYNKSGKIISLEGAESERLARIVADKIHNQNRR